MSLKLSENPFFSRLSGNYLFSEVRRKKEKFLAENGGEIIDLGVGDIAYPVAAPIVRAMELACAEMGDNVRFRGYPPETGYPFLKEAIQKNYASLGIKISDEEIFVGEGAKSDTSAFIGLFAPAEVVIPEPVYPVYRDSAALRGFKITYLSGNKENGFLPLPHELSKGLSGGLSNGLSGGLLKDNSGGFSSNFSGEAKIIWLCSPNNPTGAAYDRSGLKAWVDYATESGSVILFDAAYSAFAPKDFPRSIYEVSGAEECAVEFCSLSKSAGFTGLRCSWTVVPRAVRIGKTRLGELWRRRQASEFNGVSYVIQRGAEAALGGEGRRACRAITDKYMRISRVLGDFLKTRTYVAGSGGPYVWFECPRGVGSEEFFDRLLSRARIVGTPGSGFGPSGEGFFRISCFAKEEVAAEALERLKNPDLWD